MPDRVRPLTGGVAAALAAVVVCTSFVHAQRNPEADLKAAFVSKLPQFVEWPDTEADSFFELCVFAPPSFAQALRELTRDDAIVGRRVVVREIESVAEDVTPCQVLFFASGRRSDRQALLGRIDLLPVLTIGEPEAFLDDGGMVLLRLRDGRVRFEINAAATGRAGLRVSSQLMRLALAVHEDAR